MPYKNKLLQREYQREWKAKRRAAFFAGKKCIHCGKKDIEMSRRTNDIK